MPTSNFLVIIKVGIALSKSKKSLWVGTPFGQAVQMGVTSIGQSIINLVLIKYR